MTTSQLIIDRTGLVAGTVGLYLPGRTPDAIVDLAAGEANFVAVKGRGGVRQVPRLRAAAHHLGVALDPGMYEPKRIESARVERGGWREIQEAAGVSTLVSPGCYLQRDVAFADAQRLLGAERAWLAADRGFAAVCVDARFLRDRMSELIRLLQGVGCDVWLTLAHANDPLGVPGAVDALVELIAGTRNVSLMRCDLGGLGAVAYGARRASVGLSATVRHAALGGGGSPSEAPSVFVRRLLAWKKSDVLLAWAAHDGDVERELTCGERCCEGRSLARFADPALRNSALVHNVIAVSALIEEVLTAPPATRAATFKAIATHASFAHEWMAETVPGVKPSAQLRQWARH